MANENYKPNLNQPVPNGQIKTYPWLTTITPQNPRGYVQLYPTATTDVKYLYYAVEVGGKISWASYDDQGNIRRSFSSLQELADSGYNFGFDINATNINLLKNKLAADLTSKDQSIRDGTAQPSPYYNGAIPRDKTQPPPPAQAPGNGAGTGGGTSAAAGPNSPTSGTASDAQAATPNDPLSDQGSQFGEQPAGSFNYQSPKGPTSWYYPENIGASDQDKVVISQFQYVSANVSDTGPQNVLSGSLGNREYQFAQAAAQKTLGTVVLPMVNNLTETNQTGWGEDSLSTIAAALMKGGTETAENLSKGQLLSAFGVAGGTLAELFKNEAVKTRAAQYFSTKAAASFISKAGIQINPEAYISRATGTIINPNLELLFNGPKLRAFGLDFKMTPRSEKEARQIRGIIKFFKKGMAPRRGTGQAGIFFLGAPNIFKVTFQSGSNELKSIVQFKTCALVTCQVNYTPDGFYAAYSDSKVGSQPVAVTMSLGFAELTPVFSDDYSFGDSVGPDVSFLTAQEYKPEVPVTPVSPTAPAGTQPSAAQINAAGAAALRARLNRNQPVGPASPGGIPGITPGGGGA